MTVLHSHMHADVLYYSFSHVSRSAFKKSKKKEASDDDVTHRLTRLKNALRSGTTRPRQLAPATPRSVSTALTRTAAGSI